MKVSYNWLKELVNIDVTPKELVDDLSLYSIEVEEYGKLLPTSGLVIGEVVDKVKHENSDHLSVCQVNLGSVVSQIVCGAPNVAKGQKVIVALPGTKLPGGEIKVSVIRGVPSNGMLCSLQELGLENKYVPEKYAHGIYVLNDDAIPGEDALEYLKLEDTVIELGLTPNRMDLLSMLGVANDVNAMYNLGLKPLEYELHEIDKNASDEIDVEIQTKTCYSYYARVIEGVEIKESPEFIKARLIAAGIRPINNVVDITNYVLMLFGQPLHAFDKDELGSKIIVRRAHNGEETVTLDNITRKLTRHDIVITDNKSDGEDTRIVCLAGVMGGVNTEVTDKTKNIVLESAVFRPLSVRRTSSKLGLRSESSMRFERGVDLNRSLQAANYACYLLEKYASGKVLNGYVHKGTKHIEDRVITLTEKYVRDYLGVKISLNDMTKIFKGLGFKSEISGKEITVYVPNRRLDISIKQDLVEEIVRIYGYDKLHETLPLMSVSGEYTKEQKVKRTVHQTLRGVGLSEVITYSLVSEQKANEFNVLYNNECKKAISLLHPMSEERKYLRRTLVSSLVDVLKYNNARRIENLAIYEVGKRYFCDGESTIEDWCVSGAIQGVQSTNLWASSSNKVDFFYVKGILELLFTKLQLAVEYVPFEIQSNELHPGRSALIKYNDKIIGFVGQLHPKYMSEQDIEDTYVFEVALDEIFLKENKVTTFTSISKVPPVFRDFAFIMDDNQNVGNIIEAIYRVDKKMIKNVEIFDVYKGENIESGKKSVALKVMFESNETLTEEIINQKMTKIIKSLEHQYNAVLRG